MLTYSQSSYTNWAKENLYCTLSVKRSVIFSFELSISCLSPIFSINIVGIARCFTYGGSKNSALHDPKVLPRDNLSKEMYMSKEEKQTSINHFHEKLFKLKEMMKTEVRAELWSRSAFLVFCAWLV